MITYKEFEVIRTLLRAKETPDNIANYVYTYKHYYVFKSEDEVAELAASLEKKGYLKDGKVTEAAEGQQRCHSCSWRLRYLCKVCLQHA